MVVKRTVKTSLITFHASQLAWQALSPANVSTMLWQQRLLGATPNKGLRAAPAC